MQRTTKFSARFGAVLAATALGFVGLVASATPAAAVPAFTISGAVGSWNCTTTSPSADCRTTLILTGTELPVTEPALIGVSADRSDTPVTVNDTTANWWAGRDSSFFSRCGVVVGLSTPTMMILKVGAYGVRCLGSVGNFVHGGDSLTVTVYGTTGTTAVTVTAAVPAAVVPSVDEVIPPYGSVGGGTTTEPGTGRVVVRSTNVGTPTAVWFGGVATTDIQPGTAPGFWSVLPPPSPTTQADSGVALQLVDSTFGTSPEACLSILPTGCADEFFYMAPSTSATNFTDPIDLSFSKSFSAGSAVGSAACGKSIPAGVSASLTVGGGVTGGPLNVSANYGLSYNAIKLPTAFVASATLTVATPLVATVSLSGTISGCQAIPIPGLGIPNVVGFAFVVGGSITADASLTITINQGTYTLTGGWIPGSNPGDIGGATMVSKCVDAAGQPTTACVTTALKASLTGTVMVTPLWLQIGPPVANVGAGLSAAATGTIDFPPTAATGYDICAAGRWAAHLPVLGDLDGNWLGPINVLGDGQRCPFGAIAGPPKKDQTLTFVAPVTGEVGGTYTPTSTASSGLPVTFSVDAGSTAGACSLAAGVVSYTSPGTCVIAADQSGDTTWNAAPRVTGSTTVTSLPVTPVPPVVPPVPPVVPPVPPVVPPVPPVVPPAVLSTSLGRYVPLASPARLLDTRRSPTVDGTFTDLGVRPAGSVLQLQVTGRAGTPTDAIAAVFNVIAVDPQAGGFVTVYACGQTTPIASNLNYLSGQVVSNNAVSRVSATGTVCLFTQAATHLVADIEGYFTTDSINLLLVPTRVTDTRPASNDRGASDPGRVVAGSTFEVTMTGRAGIPNEATAVAMNVTVTEGTEAGFLTVFPCGQPRPNTSSLTYAAGQTVANSSFSPLGTDGKVCIYATGATHLIVDLTGSVPSSALTALTSPRRLLDTRTATTGDGQFSPVGAVAAGSVTELSVAGSMTGATTTNAVVLTITAIDPAAGGYLTVFPCDQPRPATSNMNVRQEVTVTTDAVAKIGSGGKVCIFSQVGTHLAVDMTGYFT